jgi:lycopene beta-cyclase
MPASTPARSQYDYIFLGMGCATLSLLMRMIRSGSFEDKSILLIDRSPKESNDRTWCFWEKQHGFFEEIVYHKWPVITVLSDEMNKEMDISPYVYKMIRGIDFYKYCFTEIARHTNIELIYAEVEPYSGGNINLPGSSINTAGAIVFNSIYSPSKDKGNMHLLQHFKGWVVETPNAVFDPRKAIIMDFRIPQRDTTTFAYCLPFSERTALVEYTLFSRSLLEPKEYDEGLRNYLQNVLGIGDYTIREEEFGVIPMTNEKLPFKGHGWQIGTAGGQTKGSSGYTFQFIQKSSDAIVQKLISGEPLDSINETPSRFRFYDNTLIRLLYYNKLPGKKIFTQLFQKNNPKQVLKFLDNESSILEELKIISTLPTWPFLKAAMRTV